MNSWAWLPTMIPDSALSAVQPHQSVNAEQTGSRTDRTLFLIVPGLPLILGPTRDLPRGANVCFVVVTEAGESVISTGPVLLRADALTAMDDKIRVRTYLVVVPVSNARDLTDRVGGQNGPVGELCRCRIVDQSGQALIANVLFQHGGIEHPACEAQSSEESAPVGFVR